MEKTAGCKLSTQALEEISSQTQLVGTESGRIPFVAIHVVDRNESWFSAHRQANVTGGKFIVDPVSDFTQAVPLVLGVGLGDARIFMDARDTHLMEKLHLTFTDETRNGSGGLRLGRCSQWYVSFTCEQARGRIKANPAGSGQVDFSPRVEVCEVVVRTWRTIKRFHVGLELNQVTGHEAGSETEPAQSLDQKPPGVAARAARKFQCFLRSLYSRLHPDHVADFALQTLVEIDEEVGEPDLSPVDRGQKVFKTGSCRQRLQKKSQVFLFQSLVLERILFRVRLEEKIERVDDRHVDSEADLEREMPGLFGKNETRQEIAVRILLPVDEMILRFYTQRIAGHRRAAVRRGPQTHGLRGKGDHAIVVVDGLVMKRYAYSHAAQKEKRLGTSSQEFRDVIVPAHSVQQCTSKFSKLQHALRSSALYANSGRN